MELPKDVEEILSDDYEEGEILDEDNFYEEVSSLEEFSGGEFECNQSDKNDLEGNPAESRAVKKIKQHAKHHRKKEHKCKEDSVCRNERKGKHCYARLKNDKKVSLVKKKTIDDPPPFNDKNGSKRTEVISVVKRTTQRLREHSPNTVRQDSSKGHKHAHKDFHEKENRHAIKKHRSNNENQFKSRAKYPEKHGHRSKMKEHSKTKYSTSSVLGSYQSDLDKNIINEHEINQTSSKTSLLKRLVGSGNAGVKTLKENEASGSCNVEIIKPGDSSGLEPLAHSSATNNSNQTINTSEEISATEKLADNSSKLDTAVPEVPTKKIEVKWMRSIKEDKGELHLRMEALKSAWIKKFSERKKKGLIQQKKSGCIDDSLVDFVLDSEADPNLRVANALSLNSDNLKAVEGKDSGSSNIRFSVSDLSGDILKPEDMIIVAQDKSNDNPIICEPALQIVTPTDVINPSVTDSSVFIASSATLLSGSKDAENNIQLKDSAVSCNVHSPNSPGHLLSYPVEKKFSSKSNKGQCSDHLKTTNDQRLNKTATPKALRGRRSLSRSIPRSDRKNIGKLRKKIKRKARRDSLKSSANSLELDDESALREQALLSLKSKSNRIPNSAQVNVPSIETNNVPTADSKCPNDKPEMTCIVPVNEIKTKNIASICESEGTGATSSDNWEDDLDEDILRAQLLSSLTKQVSERSTKMNQAINFLNTCPNINIEFDQNLRSQNLKRIVTRKNERKRLKSINKKSWKQTISNIKERKVKIDNTKISEKRYGTGNSFIKNDMTVHVPVNNQPNMVPPIPQVPKFIISLNDSDSSSDMEAGHENEQQPQEMLISNKLPPNIEANIDLLLLEAKKNAQLEHLSLDSSNHSLAEPYPLNENTDDKVQEYNDDSKKSENPPCQLEANLTPQVMDTKTPTIQQSLSDCSPHSSSDISATPQALKHLPAWQQEEYRRLKKKIAEKEKVLKVTRARITEPVKDIGKDTNITGLSSATTVPDDTSSVPEHESFQKPTVPVPNSNNVFLNCKVSYDLCPKVSNEKDNAANTSCEHDKSSNKSSKFVSKYSSNDCNNVDKKNYPTLVSCSIMEEINVMNDTVNEFDKNTNEYSDLKKKCVRLKKALKATESKMALKKRKLLQIRDKIQEKDRCISSRITSISMAELPSCEKTKPPHRDMELIKLKYKEVSLKAQFLFHDFSTEIKNGEENFNTSSLKEPLLSSPKGVDPKILGTSINRKRISSNDCKQTEKSKEVNEPPMKRSFSAKEREREEWDPNTPVCHFDLNGICKDEECKYQHFKTV